MSSQLQNTLVERIQSGWQSNPALTTLVHDYTKYHTVLVILGGIILLASLYLTVRFWMQYKKVATIRRFKWPFEKKVFFAFGSGLTVFSLFLGLVWIANLSTALNPLPGFTALASSTDVPSDSATGKAVLGWVESGSTTLPPVLNEKVQDRINWQRPKAIVCGLLLTIFIFVSVRIWSHVLRQSKTNERPWAFKDRALLFAGCVAFVSCLLLAILVIANAQGAIGPIAISLLGAGS